MQSEVIHHCFTTFKDTSARDILLNAATTIPYYYGQARELTAQQSQGPGSFYVNFLDALYNLEAHTLINNLRVTSS